MITKKINLRFGVITAMIMLAAMSRNVKLLKSEYDAKDLSAL